MFILRRITSEWNVSNEVLGERYSVVKKEDEGFQRLFNKFGVDEKETFGFILYADKVLPLYRKSRYYVMVGNGQTFEKL